MQVLNRVLDESWTDLSSEWSYLVSTFHSCTCNFLTNPVPSWEESYCILSKIRFVTLDDVERNLEEVLSVLCKNLQVLRLFESKRAKLEVHLELVEDLHEVLCKQSTWTYLILCVCEKVNNSATKVMDKGFPSGYVTKHTYSTRGKLIETGQSDQGSTLLKTL